MNLRFIERDGKKILQQSVYRDDCIEQWKDVPCVEDKQNDAIPAVDPVWCEHIKWAYWISGYAWEFVWRENHATKLSDIESREGCGYKSTCEFKFCPVCGTPRPSTKAQEVEKKEQRKLAEIMDKGHCWSFPELASVAIDAVIECYFEWYNNTTKPLGKFPEYLKEKML